MSVKSGFLLKRNEQGTWQRRYLCIVPHMFLYYFDHDMSESPRGVIDLELYTNVMRDEGGILRLTTGEDGPLRYYSKFTSFQSNSTYCILYSLKSFLFR
jgi:hypothetical protein